MAISPSPDQTITGRVVSVNPKGVRLDTHDGWCNFSKFATNLVPPARGQAVTLTLDRTGFVRSVETVENDSGATSAGAGVSRPAPGQRETVITRLALVKAAAEFAASRPQLESGDVVKITASWER